MAVDNQAVLRAVFRACRSTQSPRQRPWLLQRNGDLLALLALAVRRLGEGLSLIHISEPTRLALI
eukprot:3976894-Alexandrium_andersonii.AAC.1